MKIEVPIPGDNKFVLVVRSSAEHNYRKVSTGLIRLGESNNGIGMTLITNENLDHPIMKRELAKDGIADIKSMKDGTNIKMLTSAGCIAAVLTREGFITDPLLVFAEGCVHTTEVDGVIVKQRLMIRDY